MRKSIGKSIIILLTIMLVFAAVGANFSYAAEGTISVPSVTVGQDFTVTVNIPSDAVAYEGKISVAFSDGTTLVSSKLTKVTGIDGDYTHPGNMTYTFNASKEGNATITVTGLIISGVNGQLNQNTTLTHTFNVAANTPSAPTTPPTTPTPPSTPSAPSQPETPSASNEPSWRQTGDTVYALENLKVRSGWGTSYSSIGQLKKNSSTKRIAVGSNGWDKIDYKGTTAYVMSKYLTTQKPNEDTTASQDDVNTTNTNEVAEPSWRETGDTVYALQSLNVRNGWGTSYKAIGSLSKNASVKRIAVGSNGWDKIDYKGTTAYVMSKYLTTEKPAEDNNVNNAVNNIVDNNVVDDNTTLNEADIYNTIVDEVGVIPPVGKSIVEYIYILAVCVAIGMVAFIGFKIRENNEE